MENGQTYNQTFRQAQCGAFDAENRLISVTVGGQTTQFLYDPDGNLVKKVNPDNSKTLYVGGIYEVDKNAAGTVTHTRTYYPAGGALRVDGTLYYILKDHLGSASAITDSSGASIGTQRYYPFGETRLTTGTINTDKLFTGQREITGLGIYHYQARFYSPKLGRFLSADTIVPSYADPQSLNRFSYTVNNPLRYVDPTGHKETECASQNDPNCSAVNGGSTGNTTTKGNPPKPPDDDDDGPGGNDEGGGDILGGKPPLESESNNCSFGWVSAMLNSDGSCGHVTVNTDAIFDPLAWEHIVGATLLGIGTIVFGAMVMIPMGVDLCTTLVGCIAGIPLALAGVGAIGVGGVLVYSGVKFTQKYLNDIFVVTP